MRKKIAQMERCCRESLQRALDEVMAAGFLAPMMKRLISDRDPTDFILCKISEKWGSLKGLQVKCSNPCVLLVFASILMNPWNNPGYSMKEMTLAGRPEPCG